MEKQGRKLDIFPFLFLVRSKTDDSFTYFTIHYIVNVTVCYMRKKRETISESALFMKWVKSQNKRKIITSNHVIQRFLDLKPHIDVVGISCVKSGCHFLAFKLGLCAIQKLQILWESSLFSFNCSTEWIPYNVLSGTWWPGPSQHTPLQTQLWVCRSDVCPSQLCHLSLSYMPLSSLLYDEGWTTPNRTEHARFKRENADAVIFKRLHFRVTKPCYITHI